MKLIVGLGNPGKEYQLTRHNCGFRVLDAFADLVGIDIDREGFKGMYNKFKLDDEEIILFKPMTFMNLSGSAVQEIVHFYKIDLKDIIIVYDDMAINPGEIRLRLKGSSGGQKGMQNIIDNLSSEDIKRIRIGIGEPTFGAVDYVLGKPSAEEKKLLDEASEKAVKAIKESLLTSFEKAMCMYN